MNENFFDAETRLKLGKMCKEVSLEVIVILSKKFTQLGIPADDDLMCASLAAVTTHIDACFGKAYPDTYYEYKAEVLRETPYG